MRFGYHHATFRGAEEDHFGATLDRARWLEDAGFEWLSFVDHLWQIAPNGRHDEPFFDCYSTLPAVAAVTDELELSALVTCVHYRNPAMLARILTTLDHASDGRAVLGIGAGWYRAEYEAYGYEFPEPATRIAQLEDAIRLVRAMWTESSPVTYRGDHYAVEDAILEPDPVRDPHPPVLVGGGGEQLTLRVAAEHADRWNVPATDHETYAHKLDVLREHCEAVGRPYEEIEKTVASTVIVRDSTEAAHEAYETMAAETERGPVPRDGFRGLVGTPAEVAAGVERFAELGVELFVAKAPGNDPETLELFVEEVMPSVA